MDESHYPLVQILVPIGTFVAGSLFSLLLRYLELWRERRNVRLIVMSAAQSVYEHLDYALTRTDDNVLLLEQCCSQIRVDLLDRYMDRIYILRPPLVQALVRVDNEIHLLLEHLRQDLDYLHNSPPPDAMGRLTALSRTQCEIVRETLRDFLQTHGDKYVLPEQAAAE
jgi:hypothetical protein